MRYNFLLFTIVLFASCATTPKNSTNSKAKNKHEVHTLFDGTLYNPKPFYPNFSWNVTPQYFMFGDGTKNLSLDDAKFISERTAFICIEKNHAIQVHGAAEIGTKFEVKTFKQLNPDIKVLYYFNSAYAWPFTSYNKNFSRAKIDNYPELKSYLIKDEKTGDLTHRNNIFNFDVLNPEFRDWWVKTVVQGVADSNTDGVFIDQMHGFVWLRRDKTKEVKEAMGLMMAELRKALPKDKILLGNNAVRVKEVFPSVDAFMYEHYNANTLTKERLLEDWELMKDVAKAGKLLVYRIGVEAEENVAKKIEGMNYKQKNPILEPISKERLEYFQAAFLIGAEPYQYFQYGWGWRLDTGPLVDYPNLMKPLGKPKGIFKRVSENKWEFTREFEHANVWIDTENKKAKITWLK